MAEGRAQPLPPGWVWTTLGEVCLHPQYGWTTSAVTEGAVRLLRTTDITTGTVDWASVPYCRDVPVDVEKYLLHDGDILISRAGSVGFSHLVRQPPHAVFASYLIRFRPQIDAGYVAFFLQSQDYWQAISEASLGIAIPNVNAQKLTRISLPVAPLPEQRRIVTEIEAQFTRLDAGVAALKRVQARLRRYKAAVLQAACEGRLVPTEAELARAEGRNYEPADVLLQRILAERRARWEAEHPGKRYQEPAQPDTSELPELPEGWVWALLSQMSAHVTSGSRGWARYYRDAGSLFVRVGNFDRLSTAVKLDSVVFVEAPKGSEAERTRLQLGDLLITITADVGMVGVVDEHVLGWAEAFINQHVALVRPIEKEPMRFVAWAVASELVQRQIERKQYGATKKGLGLEDVKALSVPLPPLAEQHRIVAEVERRLSAARELEQQAELALRRAERLRQAILKCAFEGRLVPQDPNDEPESALLERIRAERQARSIAGPRQPRLPGMAGAGPEG